MAIHHRISNSGLLAITPRNFRVKKSLFGIVFVFVLVVTSIYVRRQLRQVSLDNNLGRAVSADNPAEVTRLLAAGADPNAPVLGRKPISLGAELVDLLRFRSTLRRTAKQGDPPLLILRHVQVYNMNCDLANVDKVALDLIAYGANPNIRNSHGDSPLLAAVQMNMSDVVRAMIRCGADCRVRDMHGDTPLMYSNASNSELLIMHGADVNQRDDEGATPLSQACNACDYDRVRVLLEHGADTNWRGPDGENLLHRLIDGTCVELDANWRRDPVLMRTLSRNTCAIARTLLRRGVDPNAIDSYGGSLADGLRVDGVHIDKRSAELLRTLGRDPNGELLRPRYPIRR